MEMIFVVKDRYEISHSLESFFHDNLSSFTLKSNVIFSP
jgi:hypothetical protein